MNSVVHTDFLKGNTPFTLTPEHHRLLRRIQFRLILAVSMRKVSRHTLSRYLQRKCESQIQPFSADPCSRRLNFLTYQDVSREENEYETLHRCIIQPISHAGDMSENDRYALLTVLHERLQHTALIPLT